MSKNYPTEFAPYSLELPQRTDIASACVQWTYPLMKPRQFHYEYYILLKPKVKDLSVIAKGNQLCLEGLSFGENYQLTFKEGLKGEGNASLKEAQTISLSIPHRKAAISFRERGYILPSHAPMIIPFTAVNVSEVKVKILLVPERNIQNVQMDWFANRISRWVSDNIQEEQGSTIWEGTYRFPVETDKTTISGLPISKMIAKNLEPGVYVIEARVSENSYDQNEFTSQALVVTDIGLSTYQGPDGLHVFARSLKSAQALSGVEVTLIAKNNKELAKLKTKSNGQLTFSDKLLNGKGGNQPAFISASYKGKEFTVLNLRSEAFDLTDRGDAGRNSNTKVEGFISTERGIYRPGENVHLISLLRDQAGLALKEHPLTLKLFRPDGVIAQEILLQDKGNGAYLHDYVINSAAQSGLWTAAIYLDPKAAEINHISFEVNDFVPPRIEVKNKGTSSFIAPFQSTTIQVAAQYYYGPAGANLKVEADSKLIVQDTPFAKWKNYQFGLEEENWTPLRFKHPDTKTDNEGKAQIQVEIDNQPQTTHPLQVETSINVFEIGGRARKTKQLTSFWHQPYLIGIAGRFNDNIANSNSEAQFDIIALNQHGELQAIENLHYALYQEQHDYVWFRSGTQWQYETVIRDHVIAQGKLSLLAKTPTALKVPVSYGPYRLEILDDKTGVGTSLRFTAGWYSAGDSPDRPDMLQVTFDEKTPVKGNKVKVHLKSPFKGDLFLAWAGDTLTPAYQGKIGTEAITLDIPNNQLTKTSGEYLIASVYSAQDDAAEQMPKRALGIAWFENKQTAQKHQIEFSVEHPQKVKSGQSVTLTLKNKKPSKNLRYVVALVDEGTLSLTDFSSPDPYAFFFAQKRLNYQLRDSYGLLINPYGARPGSFEVGGGESVMSRALTQLPAKAFKVVSLFSGVVEASNKESVQVPFSLPEYTGKLRVMAFAWDESSLGASESTLLVQDPIDAYLALPRFLAPGDTATVPLIINALDSPSGNYTVSWQSQGQEQKTAIALNKGDEKQVAFKLSFNDNGIKENKIHITGPQGFDLKRQWQLSVRPKVQSISLHQYHKVDPKQSFSLTPALLKNFQANNSKIMLSIGSIPELGTDALIKELNQYPYYCLEQTSSKLLATLLSPKVDEAQLQKGFNQLTTLQKIDGSFSLWSLGGPTEPWLSLYAFEVLGLAKDKGFTVPNALSAQASQWLKDLHNLSPNNADDISTIAYAHYLLAKNHQGTLRQLRFFTETNQSSLVQAHDMAFIAAAFAYYDSAQDAAIWFDKAIAAPRPANESYYAGFGSNLRNQAILVTLLAQTTLSHPKLIALVQALVDQSKEAPYLSTQEKAWLIRASTALNDARKPYSVNLDGKNIEGKLTQAVSYDAKALEKTPTLKNIGDNPVYIAISLEGEPIDVKLLPQAGFELKRDVFKLNGEQADLNNLISGELYVVSIRARRHYNTLNHILLVDLLPAGFEIDNALIAQQDLPLELSWLGSLSKASRLEARDDRFIAAFELGGQTEFNAAYIARAVTKGEYTNPPTFVEAMYQPQFFAYGDESKVQVTSH